SLRSRILAPGGGPSHEGEDPGGGTLDATGRRGREHGARAAGEGSGHVGRGAGPAVEGDPLCGQPAPWAGRAGPGPPGGGADLRSEEHTSELQSRENLVCRLLLEKK